MSAGQPSAWQNILGAMRQMGQWRVPGYTLKLSPTFLCPRFFTILRSLRAGLVLVFLFGSGSAGSGGGQGISETVH
jgi:hypothetical protein